jgi:hypothetical protein
MNTTYAKIFQSMYCGSMYGAGMNVFALWGWVLAHKDERGQVEINPQKVADELGGTAEQVQEALVYLTQPDPHSRSKKMEGRRLVKVSEFGFRVVNAEHYRRLGGSRREYWRKWRADHKCGATVAQCGAQPKSTHADAHADADADVKKKRKKKSSSGEFVPPTPSEVDAYAASIGYERPNLGRDFCQRYEASDWCMRDGEKMSNWKLVVQTWRRKDEQNPSGGTESASADEPRAPSAEELAAAGCPITGDSNARPQ